MSAARAAGRDDLIIVNEDLGENVAIAMAKGEFIKGIASQRPYDQGVTEAKLAAYALIGKPAPAYVALPAAPITRDTLLEGWKEIYHQAADRQDQGEHEIAWPGIPSLFAAGGDRRLSSDAAVACSLATIHPG